MKTQTNVKKVHPVEGDSREDTGDFAAKKVAVDGHMIAVTQNRKCQRDVIAAAWMGNVRQKVLQSGIEERGPSGHGSDVVPLL